MQQLEENPQHSMFKGYTFEELSEKGKSKALMDFGQKVDHVWDMDCREIIQNVCETYGFTQKNRISRRNVQETESSWMIGDRGEYVTLIGTFNCSKITEIMDNNPDLKEIEVWIKASKYVDYAKQFDVLVEHQEGYRKMFADIVISSDFDYYYDINNYEDLQLSAREIIKYNRDHTEIYKNEVFENVTRYITETCLKTLLSEYEYLQSDEYYIEQIEIRDLRFHSNGIMFNEYQDLDEDVECEVCESSIDPKIHCGNSK